MSERRAATRYEIVLPVEMRDQAAGQVVAISRNVSETGILAVTAAQLEVGAPVSLRLRVGPGPEVEVEGVVVRLGTNAADPHGLFPSSVAVQFNAPQPELEPALRELGAKAI